MYKLDDSAISDESQASQLLRDALRAPPLNQRSRLAATPVESKKTSPNSPRIPSPDHDFGFHGLADTQSQTQHISEVSEVRYAVSDRMRSAFTKETLRRTPFEDGAQVTGGRWLDDSRGNGGRLGRNGLYAESSKRGSGAVPVDFPVAGPSRIRDPPKKSGSRYAPRSAQSGLQRDDSFAGPLPVMEQANAFMRDSALFSKPLSKLGIDSQEDEQADDAHASSSLEVSHQRADLSQSTQQLNSGSHHASSFFVPDSDNSQGTRSRSVYMPEGQERSQSPYQHTQGSDFQQGQGHESSSDDFRIAAFGTPGSDRDHESTEPSNSFHHDYEPTQLECEPTQIVVDADNVPTQPATESDLNVSPGDDTGQNQTGLSAVTHATSPIGILSMVNPAKRWRLRGVMAPHYTDHEDTQPATHTIPETTQDSIFGDAPLDNDNSGEPTQLAHGVKSVPRRQAWTKASLLTSSVVPDSEGLPLSRDQHTLTNLYPPGEEWRASEPCDDAPEGFDGPSAPNSTMPPGLSAGGWQSSVPCDMDIPGLDPQEPTPSVPRSEAAVDAALQENDSTESEDDPMDDAQPPGLHSESLREEEEESEDDVPLALVQPKRRKTSRRDSAARMPPPDTTGRRGRIMHKPATEDPLDSDIVPSSHPQQDFPEGEKSCSNSSKPGSLNGARVVSSARKTVGSHPSTPLTRSTSPLTSPPEDETAVSGGELPSLIDKCDAETELAEDPMDIDQKEAVVNTRKRKRGASSTRKTITKQPSKVTRPTPLPVKARASSSSSRINPVEPTRVFALWKEDAHYYSGVVQSQLEPSVQYLIQFDDETQQVVELTNMRCCALQEGDSVIIIQTGDKGKVVTSSRDRVTVCVLKTDETYDLQVRDVRISAPNVRNGWNDRKLTKDQVFPVVRPKHLTETPSKTSLASAGSLRSAKSSMLSGIGLVVTLSPGNKQWESQKNRVTDAIKTQGGEVLEDWGEVFSMEGKVEKSGKRWVACKENVKLLRNFENVFLISDSAHQKPKYLIALALGIPCVSSEWLVAEKDISTWPGYLLPAGFSTQLHYRLSQLVNLDWGDEDRHLENIMSNPAPTKFFANMNILYVSSDYKPQMRNNRKTKTDAVKAQEANHSIPKIILAMGASRVEAVAAESDASKASERFDYVVVKDPHEVQDFVDRGAKCVHFKWVKDCLVSGRMLPHNFDYQA